MKYQTYAELQAAYGMGELTAENPLFIDNDMCLAYDERDEVVFRGGGPQDFGVVCRLLGIPTENV